jgi:hypothetical protein
VLVADATASIQSAAAGTSLIGCTSWKRKIGLLAASTAAATPTRAP